MKQQCVRNWEIRSGGTSDDVDDADDAGGDDADDADGDDMATIWRRYGDNVARRG